MKKVFSYIFGFIILSSLGAVEGHGSERPDENGSEIELTPGDRVEIKFDGDLFKVSSRERLSPDEQNEAIRGIYKDSVAPLQKKESLLAKVRVTFLGISSEGGKEGRVLMLENGSGRILQYRAVITRGARAAPTSVCTVLPPIVGYEQWPFAIDSIILSDLSLQPYETGTPVSC